MQTILEDGETRFILCQKIGQGGSCSVYKGYSTKDSPQKIYAIKIYKEQFKRLNKAISFSP